MSAITSYKGFVYAMNTTFLVSQAAVKVQQAAVKVQQAAVKVQQAAVKVQQVIS